MLAVPPSTSEAAPILSEPVSVSHFATTAYSHPCHPAEQYATKLCLLFPFSRFGRIRLCLFHLCERGRHSGWKAQSGRRENL